MFKAFFSFLCALLLGLMSACTNDVVSVYAPHPAFLRYAPVPTAPPLLSALNSPGQWCSITYTHLQYTIAAPGHTSITTPRTALDAYGRPRSIAGFIVGTPSLPESTGQHEARAYDLVCPSCYRSAAISRPSCSAPLRPNVPTVRAANAATIWVRERRKMRPPTTKATPRSTAIVWPTMPRKGYWWCKIDAFARRRWLFPSLLSEKQPLSKSKDSMTAVVLYKDVKWCVEWISLPIYNMVASDGLTNVLLFHDFLSVYNVDALG